MIRRAAVAFLLCLPPSVAAARQVLLSTYLGGPAEDKMTGAAVLPDGTVVIAGTMPRAHVEARNPLVARSGSGDGVLLRVDPKAGRVLAIVRLKGAIGDLDVDERGGIYITVSFGSAKFSPLLKCVWTSRMGGEKARITSGPDGASAVLSDGTVTLLGKEGHNLNGWKIPAQFVEDLACDPQTRLVFVTGFHNRRGRVPGQGTHPVQVAYVYAYDGDGKKVWTAYDWKGQDVAQRGLMADTRGYRLAIGADGKLYVAGESAGGNTMWSRQSQNLDTKLPLAGGDAYQSAHNTGANHITFVGRLDPKTGRAEAGTLLLARLRSGRGNTIRPRALAADANGFVYLGGASAAYPPVSDRAFGGGFVGGGAFFCIFDRSFRRVYAAKLCSGTTAAIGVGKQAVVAAGEGGQHLTPVNALQGEPGGQSDGWAVVFPKKLR